MQWQRSGVEALPANRETLMALLARPRGSIAFTDPIS